MSDQVSVRLAVIGGTQFRGDLRQAGAEGARSMQQIQTATRGVSPAFQAVALQASNMFGTMSGGSSALGGLAAGLSQAAISAGAFGLGVGAVVTVFGSLVPLLLQGQKSAAEMAAEMTNLQGSVGNVSGAVSALEGVQRKYTDAISASGAASGASAAAVVANSKAEFEARKQVLAVELELLRIRGAEQASDLKNLQDQFRTQGQNAMDSDMGAYGGLRRPGMPEPTGFAGRRQMGRPRPTPAFDSFMKQNEATRLAMQKLRAEATLTNLTIKQTEEALATTFKDIGTGAGKGAGTGAGAGKGKGGGGGGAVNKAAEEGKRIFEQTRTAAERYAAEVAKLNELLRAGAIDQDTYNRRLAQLDAEAARAKEAMSALNYVAGEAGNALIDALMGGKNAGEQLIQTLKRAVLQAALLGEGPLAGLFGGGSLLGKVAGSFLGGAKPFAKGGVVTSATRFAMQGGMGVMGEAGPEAIMPLTRGADGKLGVRAAMGGGGGAASPVQVIVSLGAGLTGQILGEARDQTVQIVEAGLSSYDRVLPRRIAQVSNDRRRRD
jgi:hypothetical protein